MSNIHVIVSWFFSCTIVIVSLILAARAIRNTREAMSTIDEYKAYVNVEKQILVGVMAHVGIENVRMILLNCGYQRCPDEDRDGKQAFIDPAGAVVLMPVIHNKSAFEERSQK